jgi:hypothetical protein
MTKPQITRRERGDARANSRKALSMRKLVLAALAAAALAAPVLSAAASSASSAAPVAATLMAQTSYKAVTHSADHPDTTNYCTPVAPDCVWAYDNLSMQLTATDNHDGTWTVTVTDHGSFQGFIDPLSPTNASLTSNGPIDGTYQLTVNSPNAPVNANLPSQMDGVGTGTIVATWFGVSPSAVTGGSYNFSYQNGNYTQNTAGEYGQIRGH